MFCFSFDLVNLSMEVSIIEEEVSYNLLYQIITSAHGLQREVPSSFDKIWASRKPRTPERHFYSFYGTYHHNPQYSALTLIS